MPRILSISAVTLVTHDMASAVRFYETLGFPLDYGGSDASFTSFRVGENHLNLTTTSLARHGGGWGRLILYVDDVDTMYAHAVAQGLQPEAPPRDAPWRERYFHVRDPDGHELSFAQPLARA
jgi:catechol 2,3-dioxygenase-like lactoylglutathione lyase family enzyme